MLNTPSFVFDYEKLPVRFCTENRAIPCKMIFAAFPAKLPGYCKVSSIKERENLNSGRGFVSL